MNKLVKYIIIFFSLSSLLYSNVLFDEPVNLSQLNTADNEFAPSWNKYEQTLYFTSDVTGKEKLYISKFNLEEDLQLPKLLKSPLNTAHKNLSYINFLSAKKAYFSSFAFRNGKPELQLFYSNHKKQSWTEGFIIDEIDNDKFTGHSTTSEDENQLIFTQQSKEGDLDLMISYRMEDGTWKEPIPLDILNSNGNEITPYIVSNDTLYFASDGQGGPGGYDIYFAVKLEGNWQRPSPLFELNTEYNESDVCILPNGDILFSSDRPGGKGGLDLWKSKNNMKTSSFAGNKKLKINIQSFISKIIVSNNYEYRNLPVSNSIYLENESLQINKSFFDYSNQLELQNLKTIDESYEKTLSIIGNRLQNDNTIDLLITAVYPGVLEDKSEKNSKHYADIQIKKITDFLTNNFNINKNQLNYSYRFYKDSKQTPRIEFSSNYTNLFEQFEIRNDDIKIEQSKLPINIEISPKNELSHWFIVLKTSNIEKVISEKTDVENKMLIDLDEFKKEVFETDYLNIVIKAYNKSGDSTIKSIPHSVEHHTSKKPKLTKLNKSKYNINYIIGSSGNSISNENYEDTLNEVLESITICKSIDIVYNNQLELANSIKKIIESRITNNTTTVNLIKKRSRLNSKLLDNNLIEIRIEKY